VAVCVLGRGCATADIEWPERPELKTAANGDTLVSYDMDGSGRPDYVQRRHEGRATTLYFDDDENGQTDDEVDLAVVDGKDPHLLILLDGVPHAVVAELWDEGHFRLFSRPSKVVTTFPSMTDLALSQMHRTRPPNGFEAAYFDRQTNRRAGGTGDYHKHRNSPWMEVVGYAAPMTVSARAYLKPQSVFNQELREMREVFDQVSTGFASGYSIGTAGLGTRGGKEAIREYLLTVERFCERLVFDRRGRVRLSLGSDHGHGLTPCTRIWFGDHLAKHGFRQTDSLKNPEDVVTIEYGLVTFAQFFTRQTEPLARALIDHPAVDLVTYAEGSSVVVMNSGGNARIEHRPEGYLYTAAQGDPLQLESVIETLRAEGKVSDDGTIDDAALFAATVDHVYPDPLRRIWECFHGLVRETPDVIASLRDGYCHGYWLFELGVGKVASTHGSLNRLDSVTFVMTTAGDVPEALRVADVLPALGVDPDVERQAK
jgi:hypothetical protein